MAEKPSESRFDKGGRVLYLVYESDQRSRAGKSNPRRRVKRFYLPRDSKDVRIEGPRTVKKRTGTQVNGVRVQYSHLLAPATAQRGQTTYSLPERWANRTKVIELPKSARNVRLTESPPAGARMAVA